MNKRDTLNKFQEVDFETTITRPIGFYRVALNGTGWSIGKWDGYRWFVSGDEMAYSDADFDVVVEKPMSDRDLARMGITE